MKISDHAVYNYDPITKEFVSIGYAQESPLEPGVFLIPAYATETPPPNIPLGKVAIWDISTSTWNLNDVITPEPEPEPEPEPLTWQNIELQRNTLLRSSDYRILLDANPETKELWIAYREVLRNITETFSTPESVIWPVPPEI